MKTLDANDARIGVLGRASDGLVYTPVVLENGSSRWLRMTSTSSTYMHVSEHAEMRFHGEAVSDGK